MIFVQVTAIESNFLIISHERATMFQSALDLLMSIFALRPTFDSKFEVEVETT